MCHNVTTSLPLRIMLSINPLTMQLENLTFVMFYSFITLDCVETEFLMI